MPTYEACARHYLTISEAARVRGVSRVAATAYKKRNGLEFWDRKTPLTAMQARLRLQFLEVHGG